MHEQREIRLRADAVLLEQRAAVALLAAPDGDEDELHVGMPADKVAPAVARQLGLAVRAPRRPEVHHGDLGRLHRLLDLAFNRQRLGGAQQPCGDEEKAQANHGPNVGSKSPRATTGMPPGPPLPLDTRSPPGSLSPDAPLAQLAARLPAGCARPALRAG